MMMKPSPPSIRSTDKHDRYPINLAMLRGQHPCRGLWESSCPCVGMRVNKILCHDQNTASRRSRNRSSAARRYATGVFLLMANLILSVNAVSAFGSRSYHHRCIHTRLAAASDDDASTLPLPSPKSSSSSGPPFRLERIDHVVIRCKNFPFMFDFYHRILGCTIDEPTDDHVNRFGGALTHLRAGSCFIDLLAYDINHLTDEGKDAAARMHAGGVGLDGKILDEIDLSSDTSTLDHLCLRIEPFDRDQLVNYLEEERVDIVVVGDKRLGADGVGPSVYVRDPEGNVIELKGSPYPENGQKKDADAKSKQAGKSNGASDVTMKKGKESGDRNNALAGIDDTVEDATHTNAISEESSSANVPLTPCNRICRYNSSFYDGQVCIGCFREAYEIEMWQSMTPMQKSMTLLDAIDRCSDNQLGQEKGEDNFDGAIAIEELNRQYEHWSELAKQC